MTDPTTQSGLTDERAAFEAWAGSLESWLPNLIRQGEAYKSMATSAAWHGWKKRADLSPPPSPVSQQTKAQIIAEFLEQSGQYVTNDASREAAIADAISAQQSEVRGVSAVSEIEAPNGWVLVPNDPAAPTPDYEECARQATEATGLPSQYPGAWLSIFIREINRWCLHRAAPGETATTQAPSNPVLIEWNDAHDTAWQAASAFRPSYFGDNFRAHNWVVEAIRSAHIDGQRFAQGLPKINRAIGGELPQTLREQRALAAPVQSTAAGERAPRGWKLVPIEPTETMRAAPRKARAGFSGVVACEVYQSMLAASPAPPQASSTEGGV